MSWRCRIGLHAWRSIVRAGSSDRQECQRCAKRRVLTRLFVLPTWADVDEDLDWMRRL